MKSPPEASLTRLALEAEAATVLGKLVFAFSRLEFNLGLCLRSAVSGADVNALNPLVERLTFKNKLDALLELIESQFSAEPGCLAEFKLWHHSADALRIRRNSFIHGRWGVLVSAQKVVNVAPGLPSTVPQRESRFTMHQLSQELAEVERVADSLSKLTEKWHL